MSAVGLITEYNPFHNGHLHHLRESRRVSGCEVAVAVMSGHFLQRGEPALLDKWARTRMALAAGVDVVIELPLAWACNSALHFAAGAVRVLGALGGVEALCFGSEAGELEPLRRCAALLREREGELTGEASLLLREGVSFPEARARILAGLDPGMAPVLDSPNNILGIEYLRALADAASPIIPFTIPRIGAGYHDSGAPGGVASATGIRQRLSRGESVAELLPPRVYDILTEASSSGRLLETPHLHRLLLARICQGPESLSSLYLVGQGLERRLAEAADTCGDWDELVDGVKSRQFTRTRIQRMLCHVLLGSSCEEMDAFLATGPLHLHLLGCSERGHSFLAATRKLRTLPLVGNYSRIHSILKRRYGAGTPLHALAEQMLRQELRATRLYTLLMQRWDGGSRNRDFFEPLIQGHPC